ncbi:hypothetical protein [Marinicellulosiphila megalodicopiae]|uniref:hypothetical protein n=1 Tax=Marinicellulosiphila megalodicopiae TaxID=2724896 RepID=UPI003BB209C1
MTQIDPYEPFEFKERKRFFSKKMLWALNLVLLPLIYVLSQVGVESNDALVEDKMPTEFYNLQDVVFHKDRFNGIGLHWAEFDNAQEIYFGFVINRQPIASVSIPEFVEVHTQVQGGKLWINVSMPNNRDIIYDALLFIQLWLPKLTQSDEIMIAGEVNESIVATLVENLMHNQGDFVAFFAASSNSNNIIPAPQIGDENFESFYVAYLLLLQRTQKTSVSLRWDVKGGQRFLILDGVVDAKWFSDVTFQEFDQLMSELIKNIENQKTKRSGLVRYLMHQAGYNLPVDYFQSRPLRYQQVTIQRVNEQLNKISHDKKI